VRLVNVVTGDTTWEPVAYIPVVRNQKEPSSKVRARARRNGILQRVLYLAFRTTISASRVGVRVERDEKTYVGFPRVLLYLCDQPEEKAVLCLKGGNCKFPCSSCLVSADMAGATTALDAVERSAVDTLENQIEAESPQRRRANPEGLAHLEALDSAHNRLPALAGMFGLSTEPFLLYHTVGFDCLHVRWCLLFAYLFPICTTVEICVSCSAGKPETQSDLAVFSEPRSGTWPPCFFRPGSGSGYNPALGASPRACVSPHLRGPLSAL